ncbi:hypothetical protein [Nocardioides ochotonae]|nr:hypothetical protein [Nocardioides ochotonae]
MIVLHTERHGTYAVHADALAKTLPEYDGWPSAHLTDAIVALVGVPVGDYSDLTDLEKVIVLTWLTGGAVG